MHDLKQGKYHTESAAILDTQTEAAVRFED